MEAVPRLPMISFSNRTSVDPPDFGEQLKKYIRNYYQEDPESYNNEVYELECLRRSAINASTDFVGCSTLKKYYCQLQFLNSRFSFDEAGVKLGFTWFSAFDQNSSHSGDISHEIDSILYNIGALHTALGALDSRTTSDGMKVSCTHFQCAAWAFQVVSQNSKGESELNSLLMNFMMNLSLSQAQECILEKSMTDNRKANIIAKVSMQVVDYLKLTLKNLESFKKSNGPAVDLVGSKLIKMWQRHCEFKIAYYWAVTYFHQGLQSEELQKMGERLAYYQGAVEKLEEATKLAKNLDKFKMISETLTFANDVIRGKLTAGQKENEFVYHEKVPLLASLPEAKGASLVKGISVNVNDPEVSGHDIFSRLVPIEAHQASSLYSEEKAKLLRRIVSQITEKNDEIETYLASMQLDNLAFNDNLDALPQELVECCADLNSRDAIKELTGIMSDINNVYHDIKSKIKDLLTIIEEEEGKDKEFSIVMRSKKAPNQILNEHKREVLKYKEVHDTAHANNQALHTAITQHKDNILLLSRPLNQLIEGLPSVAGVENESDRATRLEIQRMLNKVAEMQAQRKEFEDRLRRNLHEDDITKQLITSTDDTEEFFKQQLDKHTNVVSVLEQNMSAQNNILQALSEANASYASTRRLINKVKSERMEVISSLLASYNIFIGITQKAEDAKEFYSKLEVQVSKLLSRVKSLCKVKEEEREEKLNANVKKYIGSTFEHKDKNTESKGPKLKDYLNAETSVGASEFGYNPVAPETYSNISGYTGGKIQGVNFIPPAGASYPSAGFSSYLPSAGGRHSYHIPSSPSYSQTYTNAAAYYPGIYSSQSGGTPQSHANLYTTTVSGTLSTTQQDNVINALNNVSSHSAYYTPTVTAVSSTAGNFPAYSTYPTTYSHSLPSYTNSPTHHHHSANIQSSTNYPPTTLSTQSVYYPQSSSQEAITNFRQDSYASTSSTHPGANYSTALSTSYVSYPGHYSTPQVTSYAQNPSITTTYTSTTVANTYYSPNNYPSQYHTVYGSKNIPCTTSSYYMPQTTHSSALYYTQGHIGTTAKNVSGSTVHSYDYYANQSQYNSNQPSVSTPYGQSPLKASNHGIYHSTTSSIINPQDATPSTVIAGTAQFYTLTPGVYNQAIATTRHNYAYSNQYSVSEIGQQYNYQNITNVSNDQTLSYQKQTVSNYQPTIQYSEEHKVNLQSTHPSNQVNTTSNQNSGVSNLDLLSGIELSDKTKPLLSANLDNDLTNGATYNAVSTISSVPDIASGRKLDMKEDCSDTSTNTVVDQNTFGNSSTSVLDLTKFTQVTRSTSSIDPLSDDKVLDHLASETERFSKFVLGLDKKSLNGPTNLELKWKELTDIIESKCASLKISVGRCYPMSNRFPDNLPFDVNRVQLPSSRDDYINASYVKLKSMDESIPMILTQAPLPNTFGDFWTMVWENQVEIIVCLNADTEVKGQVYFPKGMSDHFECSNFQISVKQIRSMHNDSWVQRTLQLYHTGLKTHRILIQIQFLIWPPSAMPDNPGPFLQFVNEVHNLQKQQRNKLNPMVVHCISGTGRSGVFTVLSSVVKYQQATGQLSDVWNLVIDLHQQRRSGIQDRSHLFFIYSATLYNAQDALMKRGILTDKATFEEGPREKTHVRHPSADLLSSDLNRIKAKLGFENESTEVNLSRSSSQSSIFSSSSAGGMVPSGILTETPPPTSSSAAPSPSPTHSVKSDGKSSSKIGTTPLPPNLAASLDPDMLDLTGTKPSKTKKITKESFLSPSVGLGQEERDDSDPLSGLDPLWSLKRE